MAAASCTILRSSGCSDPRWQNSGGGRRAAQIAEILEAGGITTHWLRDFPAPRFSRFALLRAAAHLRFTEPKIRMRADRNLVRYLASDYLWHQWYFATHPETPVFLVEDCIDYARIRAAREAGVPIVFLPANFETWQNPEQHDFYSHEGMPGSLHREVSFAAMGVAVFCISREEQWFLANYGAKSDYLPYHPPLAEERRLTAIRRQREAEVPGGREILAVASVSNRRNRQGLEALAELVRALPEMTGFHLHVGGKDTAALRSLFPARCCTVHDELTDAGLNELMVRCRASLIFQAQGAGALTRIPEMLCAGVPVLANPHAARSQWQTPGVYLYRDPVELAALLTRDLSLPQPPSRDTAAERRLVTLLHQLAARRRDPAALP